MFCHYSSRDRSQQTFEFSFIRFLLGTDPEVREFIRDTKPRTNTTRGGRRARHPETTLPHRPPGTPAAVCSVWFWRLFDIKIGVKYHGGIKEAAAACGRDAQQIGDRRREKNAQENEMMSSKKMDVLKGEQRRNVWLVERGGGPLRRRAPAV